MATVRLSMDAGLFSADVVARTAHRYTDRFFVELTSSGDAHTISLISKNEDADLSGIESRFRNDALDQRLRECIKAETADLHVSLVQAALRQAMPTGPES